MYKDASPVPGMLLLRIDAPLYFANVEAVKEYIRSKLDAEQRLQTVHVLLLDLAPVTDIDSTALHFLMDFIDELRDRGVRLALSNPTHQALQAMRRARVAQKIGACWVAAPGLRRAG